MIEVVAGFVCNKGKILIAQKSDDRLFGGLWEFAGGKVQEGETFEQCLERELLEELDVVTQTGEHIVSILHNINGTDYNINFYFSGIVIGTPKPIKEHKDIRWVSLNELKNYNFCYADTQFVEYVVQNNITLL